MDEHQLVFQIDVCIAKQHLQQLPRDDINNICYDMRIKGHN